MFYFQNSGFVKELQGNVYKAVSNVFPTFEKTEKGNVI